MSARHPVTSLAHLYLNTFAELLHSCKPKTAIAKFSKIIAGKQLDTISANALFFVTNNPGDENLKKELLSRVCQTKMQIDLCVRNMSNFALRKLKDKSVVVHPLDSFSAPILALAKSIKFIQANDRVLHLLPAHKLQLHKPLTAHKTMTGTDVVLLEPTAITNKGVFVASGGMLLAELAKAKGVPVYVLATSWHAVPSMPLQKCEECIPADLITGIISEYGIFGHKDFLNSVKKTFPWIL